MRVLVFAVLATTLACGDGEVEETFDASTILTDDLSMPAAATIDVENFRSAEACSGCHIRHYEEWTTSMHAYAMIDPVYRALVAQRQIDFSGMQDMFCLQCHSAVATRGGEIQPGFQFEELSRVSLEGVTCEVCHKIAEVARPYNAGFVLDQTGPMRGPIPDPVDNSGAHESVYSELHESALFCSACHDVVEVDGLNLERPFAEWTESPAAADGQICQDCHMPAYEGRATFSSPRRTLHEHRWVGVDLPLSEGFLSDSEREELRVRVAGLLDGAASLNLEVQGTASSAEELAVLVHIRNNIPAHNLPTGSTFNRQVWLELVATDATDRVIYVTGDLDDNGDLRNVFSSIDPYGDPDLITLNSGFVDSSGAPEVFPWRAAEHLSGSLSPLYERTHTLFIPIPEDAVSPLTLSARLRFRGFPPFLLRALGLGELIERLEIFEVDSASIAHEIN